jgi:hypothetical protein
MAKSLSRESQKQIVKPTKHSATSKAAHRRPARGPDALTIERLW